MAVWDEGLRNQMVVYSSQSELVEDRDLELDCCPSRKWGDYTSDASFVADRN